MLDPSLIPLVQRLDRDPEDQDAVQQLWRALSERGDFQTLAILGEKVAGRRRTPTTAAELLFRAAELWSRELGRDERAVPLWQRAMELDPLHDAAVSSLAGAYVRAGRTDLATPLHRRVLERAQDPRRKLPILEQMSVMRAEAGDVAGQLAVLREIVALDLPVAATVEHRRALARLLVQQGRAAQGDNDGEAPPDIREAARMLGTIAREGGTARAADFAAAALALWPGEEHAFSILQATLSLRHAELATLRIKFLSANPTSRMASQVRADLADGYLAAGRVDDAIAVLAASVSEDAGAAQRLTRLYERTGRHKDLAALLDSTPLPSDAAQRLVLLRRRATAHRAVGDRKAHLAALRAVLDASPADAEALGEVERDCRLRGDLVELRARLEAAAASDAGDAAARVRRLREVAQIAERAGDIDAALAHLERASAIAEEADVDELFDAITRILSHLDRWDDLLERLAVRAVNARDAAGRRRWWFRWIDAQRLHRPDAAREAEVLSTLYLDDPTDDALALSLADAHRRAANPAGVEAVLLSLVARATPENAGKRWSQLAGHREQVGNAAGALEAWRQARTLDASQAMAWAAEERILEQTGQRRELLEVLTAHAGHPTATGRHAGEIFTRAALLARELGQHTEATRLAKRALTFVPDDPALRDVALTWSVETPPEPPATHTPRADDAHEDVPLSLLEDHAASVDDALEHDTGEFPVAIPDEASGVFVADAASDTGEHAHDTGEHAHAHDEHAHTSDEAIDETRELAALVFEVEAEHARDAEAHTHEIAIPAVADALRADEAPTRELRALDVVREAPTAELRSLVEESDEPPTRELRALTQSTEPEARTDPPVHLRETDASDTTSRHEDGLVEVPHDAHDDEASARDAHGQATSSRESQPPSSPERALEELIEEPTRPLQAALREVRSEIARQSVLPPTPVRPITPTLPARPIAPVPPVAKPSDAEAPSPTNLDAPSKLPAEPEELTDDSILVEVDLSALDEPAAAVSEARTPDAAPAPPPTRVSVPPPPPTKLAPVTAPKDPSPAEELPSIIIDDDLLASPAPAPTPVAAPAPVVAPIASPPHLPGATAPLAGMPPPKPSSPRVVIPPLAQPPLSAPLPPLSAPLPPLSAPLPPLSAPLPPLAQPVPQLAQPTPPLSAPLPPLAQPIPPLVQPMPPLAQPMPPLAAPGAPVLPPSAASQSHVRPAASNTPAAPLPFTQNYAPPAPSPPTPALPPLSASGFVAHAQPPSPAAQAVTPYLQPPQYAQPLPPLAQSAPVGAHLAPLAPPPGSPLGGDPFSGPAHGLPPLGGPAFSAAPAPPPLTYAPDNSGDPFASAVAPVAAFVGGPAPLVYAPDDSGDPFASKGPARMPSAAPMPVSAPMPAAMPMPALAAPPTPVVSNYQKTMAAMFEQAIASIRS
jgi:tetratricopeptide (TPR) repeat protein